MDKYTIDETQYKNGYRKGYEDGRRDAVEVVHGRWYWKPSGEKQWTLTCSVCESQDGTSESYNYCPNCGAKMDGGKTND